MTLKPLIKASLSSQYSPLFSSPFPCFLFFSSHFHFPCLGPPLPCKHGKLLTFALSLLKLLQPATNTHYHTSSTHPNFQIPLSSPNLFLSHKLSFALFPVWVLFHTLRMADNSLNDGGFWLPSEFLTDEDILVGKENFDKNGLNSNNNPCFPTELPYGFGSFDSSSLFHNSPVESVTESESDEDDFLTGLTCQFARSTLQETHKLPYAPSRNQEKTWVLSGSPQSTLSPAFSNGSPNGPSQGPSPPTSPSGQNSDPWDLICEAAGQVNMLKIKNEVLIKSRGLLGPTHKFIPLYPPTPATGLYNTSFQQVKQVGGPIWGQQQVYQNRGPRICVENGGGPLGNGRCGRELGLPESARPTLQVQKHQFYQNQQQNGGGGGMRAVFPGGGSGGGYGGVKRECAGTGVFLPRRYVPFDSRKKSGGSTAILPARVVQVLNRNFDTMTTQAQTQAQPHFNGGLFPEYDVLIARRNALLAQQRRSSMRAEGAMNYETRLPQEWTY